MRRSPHPSPQSTRSRVKAGSPQLNRRSFLAASSTALAGMAIGGPRITFGQESSPAASPAATAIASGVDGVPDVYLSFPKPVKTYDGVPGKGGSVRVFSIGYSPPPTPHDDNSYWQQLEERLGVSWEVDIAPQPNYGEKSAAYLAGGDLPDLFYLNPGQNASHEFQAMTQGAFLDLTPYLTGDALQQFPNLSTFPQYMWDNIKFQGKIFGVPRPSVRSASQPFYRADWSETVGIEPETLTDTAAMLAAFSAKDPNGDGSANTWGMGRYNGGWWIWDNRITQQGFRVPNNWRLNDDGTLTNAIETDEFRQAIEFQVEMFKQGVYHPDSAGMSFSDAQTNFVGGVTGLFYGGTTAFFGPGSTSERVKETDPNGRLAHVPIVGTDGQPGVTHNSTGSFGYTGIPSKVTDEARILELLHILDYLAAPFGSEERLFLNFGTEGEHFDFDDSGAPVPNDTGNQQRSDLVYLMTNLEVLYYANDPDVGLVVQDILKTTTELGIDDPTASLFSQTNIDQGPILGQLGADSITPIVTGRESIDALQAAIDQWKSQGGDQIRNEYPGGPPATGLAPPRRQRSIETRRGCCSRRVSRVPPITPSPNQAPASGIGRPGWHHLGSALSRRPMRANASTDTAFPPSVGAVPAACRGNPHLPAGCRS